jgi:RNA polymerase sigma-70 factor (ECF subfamily)
MQLAFIALLQHLPGRQRAAILLRDVVGFSAAQAAGMLEVSVPALNSALQRARAAVRDGLPPPDDPSEEVARVAGLYARAWEEGDVDAIVALLHADAEYSMPPLAQWFRGHDAIRAFLLDGPLAVRWRFIGVRANGQEAFGTYAWDAHHGAFVATALDLVRIRGGLVTDVVSFLTPDVFSRFGLPPEISEGMAARDR